MIESVMQLFTKSGLALWNAFYGLLIPAIVFAALAVIVKRRRVFADAWKALPEVRVALLILVVNTVLVAPVIALFSTWMNDLFRSNGLHIISPAIWDWPAVPIVVFAAVFAGDFVGYWRHRLEHTRLFWPAHAVHHSDTQMTWLALQRIHPINFLTTLAIDNAVLLLLGFPAYALIANNLVRHYYGYLIHADLPWTYDRFGGVFVSPAMHRWHHAADRAAFDTNFATVFSVFDRWFGTFRVPGPCTTPLGVSERIRFGAIGQLLHPFRPSAYRHPGKFLRIQAYKLRTGTAEFLRGE